MRFKGGRGVATSLGVFLALLPAPTVCALVLWSAALAISKRVSAASVSAAFAYPFLVAVLAPETSFRVPLLAAASLVAALILVRHVPNIRRLAAGTEPRTIGRKAGKP